MHKSQNDEKKETKQDYEDDDDGTCDLNILTKEIDSLKAF